MKWSILLITALISVLAFSGCKKSKLNKLTGSWVLLPQNSTQQNDTTIYTFNAEDMVYVTVNNVITDTGVYNFRSDFLKYYIDFTDIEGIPTGDYWVEKLNKKIMVLQCESPYNRKEFTRHEE